MSNPARHERQVMCDVFQQFGPDAPTLCEGWSARDLAAHLIVRETRPDAAIGILVKKAEPYSEKVRRSVADKQWPDLIDTIRKGPPKVSPMTCLRWTVSRTLSSSSFTSRTFDERSPHGRHANSPPRSMLN